ncbi:MAG: hypothetical protein P1U40_05450 [Coxiellaceae bacterium]|nr:hypothetical protein [Coxiellaceae bacterium]
MRRKLNPFHRKLQSLVETPQAGVTLTYSDNKLILQATTQDAFLRAFRGAGAELPIDASVQRQLHFYGFKRFGHNAIFASFAAVIPAARDVVDAISYLQIHRTKRKPTGKRAAAAVEAAPSSVDVWQDTFGDAEAMNKRIKAAIKESEEIERRTDGMQKQVADLSNEMQLLQDMLGPMTEARAAVAPPLAGAAAPAASLAPVLPASAPVVAAAAEPACPDAALSPAQSMASQGLFASSSPSCDGGGGLPALFLPDEGDLEAYLNDLFGDDPTGDLPPTP